MKYLYNKGGFALSLGCPAQQGRRGRFLPRGFTQTNANSLTFGGLLPSFRFRCVNWVFFLVLELMWA